MIKEYAIYCLIDNAGEVFYVGMSENVEIRTATHRLNFGKDISCRILEKIEGTKKDALALEKNWIRKYIDYGYPLLNRQNIVDIDTRSVRVSKELIREIKINIANYGGTIRSILERGAEYAMGENMHKGERKKKKVS